MKKISILFFISLGHVVIVTNGFMRMSVDPTPTGQYRFSAPTTSEDKLRYRGCWGAVRDYPSATTTTTSLSSSVDTSSSVMSTKKRVTPGKARTLGLITFDLDDSLYPIDQVLRDANNAFVRIMSDLGCSMVGPEDIDAAGREIRANAGPLAGAPMTHTDVRLLAIRSEMEKCATICGRTEVVKDADVERVYSAWERERHHSAERHLYPDVISTLLQIKEAHPDVIIGAVTDGKANPLQMVFTLAPYFDFCTSWEDDASGRAGFFKELSDANGHADLQWIYRTAYEKYMRVAETRGLSAPPPPISNDDDNDDAGDRPVWIHIGDDLAYDVGGSASCGAHTILLDLDEEYNQTSKMRFLLGNDAVMPSWSTASDEEIAKRRAMNDASEMMVDKRVTRLSVLADAIDEILKGE